VLFPWTWLGKLISMSVVQQLEEAVRQLSAEEQAEFRAWFAEFDAADWDRQFEAGVAAGRLDWLAEEARGELRAGRCYDGQRPLDNRVASLWALLTVWIALGFGSLACALAALYTAEQLMPSWPKQKSPLS
jgi:hypothetical protein